MTTTTKAGLLRLRFWQLEAIAADEGATVCYPGKRGYATKEDLAEAILRQRARVAAA
jgi:hypothetical protein